MTWEGQNYLESVRDNTRWGKIKNIYKAKLGKKSEIVLYRTDKRKLITVDCLADNFERLFDMLYDAGLIHEKRS